MTESFPMIVCPVCLTLNQPQSDELSSSDACNHCNSPLFNTQLLTLTSANFNAHARISDVPLLIEFWSSEYHSMLPLGPAFAAAAGQLEPKFRLGRLDIEEESAIAAEFEIQSIPTFLIIRHGREMSRRTGAMLTRNIVEWSLSTLSV